MKSENEGRQDRETGGRGVPRKIGLAAKVFRATTAVVVFGIPLAVGLTAVIGYGVSRACKRLAGKE